MCVWWTIGVCVRCSAHPHGTGYPGQEAGHSGVDAGFLCHGAARPPADHAQQPVAARLRQTVGCYEGTTAVSLK